MPLIDDLIEEAPIGAGGPAGAILFGALAVAQLVGSLIGLFGGGGPPAVTQADLQSLRDSVSRAIETVTRFAWKIAFALGALLRALEFLWANVLKKLLLMLLNVVKRLGDLIAKVIGPMLRSIHSIRDLLNKLYDRYLRPALAILQKVRKVLQILRLLHVPFAAKLDGILARIQGRIIAPYLWILRTVNGLSNWINIIITAKGTLQHGIFTNTLYRHQDDAQAILVGGMTRAGRGQSPLAPVIPEPAQTPAQVSADFGDLVKFGIGPYAAPQQETVDTFRSLMNL